jgi:hypothetical protein
LDITQARYPAVRPKVRSSEICVSVAWWEAVRPQSSPVMQRAASWEKNPLAALRVVTVVESLIPIQLASVEGECTAGGLVGNNYGSVVACYCSCTLTALDQIGGLVGINHGIITTSYSSATVNGRYEVGGLVGFNSDDAEIVDCYANGNAIGYSYVGGLVGNNVNVSRMGLISSGTILNCYSVAHVSGDYYYIGGLVGSYEEDGISGSFWDIQTSGQVDSYAGIDKTTLEMQDPQTFIDAGWDFFLVS